MAGNPPMIRTARLLLRPPVQDDFPAWAAFSADEEAMRFLGGVQPREIAWRSLATMAGSWALETLAWPEFIHHIAPENIASASLAARLGSTNRGPGHLPPPWNKERIDFWGQMAAQWRQRRGGAR
ncbi:MAG: GNAT family N-acetyltransferase [Acidiphilium sp.]